MKFLNRSREINRLDEAIEHTKRLVVIIGRRRVGKTRLLRQWGQTQLPNYVYAQAIESTPELQVKQLYLDLKSWLATTIEPKNWEEFLELLSTKFTGKCLIIDEFPYLVEQDRSLPSRLQRRLDAGFPFLLILSGSSQTMMESEFLNDNSPLYQRADDLFYLQPMEYEVFCKAMDLEQSDSNSFELYSLVGGVPKYWEWIKPKIPNIINAAEYLFFNPSAPMNFEPTRIMQDEKVDSIRMKAVLDCIGHGDVRPNHIASRMNCKQSSLSIPLTLLTKCGLIQRLIPAGHSEKNPKIVQYRINDPAMRFWFETYQVHLSNWSLYEQEKKRLLIHQHASIEFEHWVINQLSGVRRFWNSECEIDGMKIEENKLILYDVKWKKLKEMDINRIVEHYKNIVTKFFSHYSNVELIIIDSHFLKDQNVKTVSIKGK